MHKIQFNVQDEIKDKIDGFLEWGVISKIYSALTKDLISVYELAEEKGIDKHIITAMILAGDINSDQ